MGKKILSITLFIIMSCFLLASAQEGDVKSKSRPRWMLEFSANPPQIFTYSAPRNVKENYCYFIFSITNDTDDNIRLGIDVCVRAILDENKPERDIYYQDAIRPLIEDQMIVSEEKLAALNQGLQKERIKELKKQFKYLNSKDLMDKKEIKPKETIKCIATFPEFDKRSVKLEVMIGGLTDVVKWRYDTPSEMLVSESGDKVIYEYECKIYKIIYDSKGGEFWSHNKMLKEIKKEWLLRNYGPVGDKNGLKIMAESLKDPNPLLRWTGWYLLNQLTGMDFNYDMQKDPADESNVKAIDRYREWIERNSDNLIYNSLLNKFNLKPEEK